MRSENVMETDNRKTEGLQLLWGAAAIADFLGISTRQAYHGLEKGHLPGVKAGAIWTSTPQRLRKHFEEADHAQAS